MRLTVANHDRDVMSLKYVYPVVSRRSGGVSLGVNLNPNNACNWRCIYCQVPDLSFGKGPPIDLARFERELREMLGDIVEGDFMQRSVPEGSRELRDVAFSGNGEPTTSPQLGEAIDLVGEALSAFGLLHDVELVLITNGSMLNKPRVQRALRRLSELGGRVWFKLDSVTVEGSKRINANHVPPDRHIAKLGRACELCVTWIQTCMFALDGEPPPAAELDAYVECMGKLARARIGVAGVMLYSLARPPQQPEASRLSALPRRWLEALAQRIEAAGVPVCVVP